MVAATPGAAPGRTRVAILGGGPAGLSTAFWLTATEALRQRFEVTIYSPGWRIGGKCASGRDQGRILEHGLHILMGCYRNVFATICACYGEWKAPPGSPFQKWSDAFTPQFQVSLPQQAGDGSWSLWNFVLPGNDSKPSELTPTPTEGMEAAFEALLAGPMQTLSHRLEALVRSLGRDAEDGMEDELQDVMDVFRRTASAREAPAESEVNALYDRLDRLHRRLPARSLSPATDAAAAAEFAPAAGGAGWICPLGSCGRLLADLGLALVKGYLLDVFLRGEEGIARLNAKDFRQWLAGHGASTECLASAPIHALYDLTFAFPGGDASDIAHGAIAAGVTLRFMMEACFDYAGAPLWKMNAGTGDTLFMPMYEVLQARGVAFRFFHQVREVALGGDGHIGQVTIAQQAALKSGPYRPLQDVLGLPCWPATPLWDQIVDGEKLSGEGIDYESPDCKQTVGTLQLQAGRDVDAIVLATPPVISAQIAPALSQDAGWKAMMAHSASVATGAFQLWLNQDVQELGWTLGTTVLTGYQPTYESWGDMSHLLKREPPGPAKNIAYFCGCRPDNAGPDCDPVFQQWQQRNLAFLWPKAVGANGLDPRLVVHSYCRLNTLGSERYVLTPPGSVQFRLSPLHAVFGCMYVAGDWTLTRFSGGCVESAFESGVLAAAAIQRDFA